MKDSEWISVKDRLPGINESVIVVEIIPDKTRLRTIKIDGMKHKETHTTPGLVSYYIAYLENSSSFTGDIRWRVNCMCSGYEVDREYPTPKYWMPLPKPPKD